VDGSGTVYVGDAFNHRIRKVTSAGAATTLSGTGTAGFADAVTTTSGPTAVYTGTALSYADTGLTAGTSYTYTVTATGRAGTGPTSNTAGPLKP
jgi:hypothetical protein